MKPFRRNPSAAKFTTVRFTQSKTSCRSPTTPQSDAGEADDACSMYLLKEDFDVHWGIPSPGLSLK
jgi:hypothetical protein